MRAKLDDLDLRILEFLYEDGRVPAARIARRLGFVSAKTVANRIGRLVDQGFVEIKAVGQPRALGYRVAADISIEVEMGRVGEVAQALKNLKNVSYVALVAGDRDLQTQVVAVDIEDLQRFILSELQAVPGIQRTKTSVLTEIVTATRDWRIPAGPVRSD